MLFQLRKRFVFFFSLLEEGIKRLLKRSDGEGVRISLSVSHFAYIFSCSFHCCTVISITTKAVRMLFPFGLQRRLIRLSVALREIAYIRLRRGFLKILRHRKSLILEVAFSRLFVPFSFVRSNDTDFQYIFVSLIDCYHSDSYSPTRK